MSPAEARALHGPMIEAEAAVLAALAPLIPGHGCQSIMGATAAVLGGLLGVMHAAGKLDGSVADNLARVEQLLRMGLRERVTQGIASPEGMA